MRLLILDAALGGCLVAVVVDGTVIAARTETAAEGQAGRLAEMAEAVLAEAGPADAVAVTLGPGGFTGLRAAIALAHGIALGAGVPVVGVSVGEALTAEVTLEPGWVLWCAIDSRRAGRVFLEAAGRIVAVAEADLPRPGGAVAVAGNAATAIAARLAARGITVRLTAARVPSAVGIALAAEDRLAGRLVPREVLPIYVDPPAARLPAGGLRPPPIGAA